MLKSSVQVYNVPQANDRDQEVEASGTANLLLLGSITNFAVPVNREPRSKIGLRNIRFRTKPRQADSFAEDIPVEILTACHKLRQGDIENDQRKSRPKFGGRILVRHPTKPNFSAVVALERSARDRRIAVFCVLLQDGLKISLGAGRGDHLAMLTIAERRVAKLVADGLRNSDIATVLGKSVATVKSQLMTVYSKLNIGSRTQLVTLLRSSAMV